MDIKNSNSIKVDDQTLNRIKKLLEHAESAKSIGSIKEAETFLMAANKMLLKFNLTEKDLSKHNVNFIEKYKINLNGNIEEAENWIIELLVVLCRANLCEPIFYSGKNPLGIPISFGAIIGKEENADIVYFLFSKLLFMLESIVQSEYFTYLTSDPIKYAEYPSEELAKMHLTSESINYYYKLISLNYTNLHYSSDLEIIPTKEGKFKIVFKQEKLNKIKNELLIPLKQWRESFLTGVVIGLNQRFEREREELQDEFDLEYGEGGENKNGLIKINSLVKIEMDKLKEFINSQHESINTLKTEREEKIDSQAYSKGVDLGLNVKLDENSKTIENAAKNHKNLLLTEKN